MQSSPIPASSFHKDISIIDYPENELVEYITQLRCNSDEGQGRLVRITKDYVSKCYDEEGMRDTKQAIELAISLDVRVPPIKRIAHGSGTELVECIQPVIQDETLMEVWHALSWFRSLRLAFQLRGMVKRMRTAMSRQAGSLSTGTCRSFWFEDSHGVPKYASQQVISSIVNFWYNFVSFRQEARKTPEEHVASCSGPITPQPFVFTHHDLAPRNLILDRFDVLWVVDWDLAGWYPSYFEYAAMHNFLRPDSWGKFTELRWDIFVWIATGSFWKESRILSTVQRKGLRYRPGRRFNIRAGVTPSERPLKDDE